MSNTTLVSAPKRVPEIASLSIAVISCLALLGWAIDNLVLKSVLATLPPMRPIAAIGLILGSASLWLLTARELNYSLRKIGEVCAVLVSLVGLLTVIQYLFSVNLGIDGLLFQPELETVELQGRLPVSTALSFMLSGIALLTLHIETSRGNRPSQFLALTVVLICLMTLLSHGYGIVALYHFNPGMALNTAVALILLSAGILSTHADQGLMAVATSQSAGGFMLRRLLLAVLGVPSILGWLNVAGTQAGLYPREFGVAMLVTANVVLFLVVIWRNAQLLHLMDSDRQHAVDALRRSNDELESRVKNRTAELTDANDALRTEITERRRVAVELHRSQQELADFFENATIGLHWVGPDGTIQRANRAELAMLGYDREEYVGHRISEFHADEEVIADILRHLSEGETLVEYPARLRAKDGSLRHVLINSNVLWDGDRFIHTRCFTRDITESKRVEDERNQLLVLEQAARSKAEEAAEIVRRLQTITDSALSHLDLDDLLREMLGRLQELLGADAAAILLVTEDGQFLAGRAAIGLDEEARVLVPMGRGVAGRIAQSRAPLIVEDLSKVEVVSSILSENASSLVGAPLIIDDRVIGVIHVDTLEPHCFTEEDVKVLQLAADRVAVAIEHSRLYEAEQRARVEAEAANRMKDEFLATISHELRSPLNSILGWVTLLRKGKLSAQAERRAFETVERSARAQNRIISDLLDVSRIINGQLHLNVRSVQPGPMIEAGVEAVRPAADAKGIEIQIGIDRQAGPIAGDSDRLQQIVWNLVSNAIKFTPNGGVVQVSLESVGSNVEIVVSDTGAGISPQFLPFVFDRFRQADSSSTRKQGGLGLGLAIVRHLVELHGGTVHAYSDGEDRGATFVVKLPLMASVIAEEHAPPAALSSRLTLEHPPQLKGLRVLVVENEAQALDLVSAVLAECEAEVRTATTSTEALAILGDSTKWRPDVVISDIEMSDSDAGELIRRVRTLRADGGAYVPAVALTAYARSEDRMKALAAGFHMHVPKPVEPAELVTVLGCVTGRLPKSTGSLLLHDSAL
jgi:PAS domain S-box-containing protein